MSPSGFVAEAALAAARGDQSLIDISATKTGIRQLIGARTAVNRYGALLNQAAAQLNTAGQPPPWLERAVARTEALVARVDLAVTALITKLP